MSLVTNCILACFIHDDDKQPMLDQINKFFGEMRGFELVDSPALPRGWYGGTKMLETDLMIGAFNYLELEGLVNHLKSLTWDSFQAVQLIVKEQDDNQFRIITIVEAK